MTPPATNHLVHLAHSMARHLPVGSTPMQCPPSCPRSATSVATGGGCSVDPDRPSNCKPIKKPCKMDSYRAFEARLVARLAHGWREGAGLHAHAAHTAHATHVATAHATHATAGSVILGGFGHHALGGQHQ